MAYYNDDYTIHSIINLFIRITYKLHTYLLSLNDNIEQSFTDKQLHFLVIGILGVVMIVIIGPIFRYLAKKHLTILITWLFVFMILLGVTFAIEIAQGYSGTGYMDFQDIVYGIKGYFVMSGILIFVYAVIRLIIYLIKKQKLKAKEAHQ